LNKWDFLTVFQAAKKPIRDARKTVIPKLIPGFESANFQRKLSRAGAAVANGVLRRFAGS